MVLERSSKEVSKGEKRYMPTHGETIQILEENIKELQDRLITSDKKIKTSLIKDLKISEERVKILHKKIGELNKLIKELENEIDHLTETNLKK